MIHWRHARVRAVQREWPGVRELLVDLTEPLPGGPGPLPDGSGPRQVRAVAYTELVGVPEPGDAVLLNVSALARGLGTGGFALVVALPEALPADPQQGPGHLVKDRYSPLQTMVLGVDDQESEHYAVLSEAHDLDSLPVIVADLHSALPAAIAGIRAADPDLRIAYLMTDGAALPLPFSQTVAGLQAAGWLGPTISVGQAWGGDFEAVTVHSALLAARVVCRADIAIVSQGPGNLGTGTPYGFSGMVVGDHLRAAAMLGGLPIALARMSNADARGRHFGISHHTRTAVGRGAAPGCIIPLPDLSTLSEEEVARCDPDPRTVAEAVGAQTAELAAHDIRHIGLEGLFPALESAPVRLSTMGRGLYADAAAFLAAAAAGRCAAQAVRRV
ncbi:DUF3866 family protein [Brevibacterium daeguense]|uniref:DUF3866 family protein n=1 Tax=Brevibacterium daeguense TaxID=909936 RepID=A0ABP8ENH0_9MICO|nr:DUF3866 family protein [Brevibacterium daeguense]